MLNLWFRCNDLPTPYWLTVGDLVIKRPLTVSFHSSRPGSMNSGRARIRACWLKLCHAGCSLNLLLSLSCCFCIAALSLKECHGAKPIKFKKVPFVAIAVFVKYIEIVSNVKEREGRDENSERWENLGISILRTWQDLKTHTSAVHTQAHLRSLDNVAPWRSVGHPCLLITRKGSRQCVCPACNLDWGSGDS